MWYLITVVWIAVMAAIVYSYGRKRRRRAGERAQDMEKMLAELKTTAKIKASGVDAPAAQTAEPRAEFTRKPRLLPQPAALLYYVFRTGLPDHEIFAGVPLIDVLDIAATEQPAQREQLRRKLGQHRLDLVICTKQLEVVAGVITGDAATDAESAQFIERCLQAAGVRLLRIDPAAPPRHHQVQALVYG